MYILMTQINSRLEIAKKFLRIALTYLGSILKYENLAFFPWKNEKIVYDSVVTGSHLW